MRLFIRYLLSFFGFILVEAFCAFAWWGPIAWVVLSLIKRQWQNYVNISLVIWSFLAIITWLATVLIFWEKIFKIANFAEKVKLSFSTIYGAVVEYDFPISYPCIWMLDKEGVLAALQRLQGQESQEEERDILAARFNRR